MSTIQRAGLSLSLSAAILIQLAGSPAHAQVPSECGRPRGRNTWLDPSEARSQLASLAVSRTWSRQLADSIESLQAAFADDRVVSQRFEDLVTRLARSHRAETISGLAFLISEPPISQPDVSRPAIQAYFHQFGAAYPVLFFVETRGEISKLSALQAIRAVEDSSLEPTIFDWACDAAWLVVHWNRDGFTLYRPWVGDANLLLPQAYRLLTPAHRAAFDSIAMDLFPRQGKTALAEWTTAEWEP